MAAKTPLAFLSYAHFDDAHENGRLRTFAERLSGEVRLQWGEEFPIFIDRNNLKWGQEWKSRIEQSLDDVTFLIPILTPGYFKSEWCRKECLRFLERESSLKRNDLILPVYYVRCPVLEDGAKRAGDELAQLLQQRQYKDWRNFRHEPWTTPEIARQFERMALEVVEALQRTDLVQPVVVTKWAGPQGQRYPKA
jgi:cobaltochelatase CobT